MRFLFVDRILEIEKGKSAKGIKNVSFSDEYLVNIVPNYPVMPRPLTIEAIAQLISWLVIWSKDFTVKPVAVMTECTKFYDNIRPGDQMVIRASIKSMHDEDALCEGSVEVDGKIVTELINGVCGFVPLDDLEDIRTVKSRAFSLFGRRTLDEFINSPEFKAQREGCIDNDRNFNLNVVDKVIELKPGEFISGVKSLTMTESFVTDHFPKKHVMPGTMIIEIISQLSERLLEKTLGGESGTKIKLLIIKSDKVKFRKYVVPGDQMFFNVTLTEMKDETVSIKAKVMVDEKLVSSGKLEFQILRVPE